MVNNVKKNNKEKKVKGCKIEPRSSKQQLLGCHAEPCFSNTSRRLQNGASLQWYHVKLGRTVSGTPCCVNTRRERAWIHPVFFTDNLVLTDATIHSFLGLHSNRICRSAIKSSTQH